MRCCVHCFGNPGIERLFVKKTPTTIPRCPVCETPNAAVIDAILLRDDFETLIEIYDRSDAGVGLAANLRRDWGLFTHEKMDDARAQMLLAEVLDDGEKVRHSFVPSPRCRTESVVQWDAVRKELIEENRFFLKAELDRDRLKALLAGLVARPGSVPSTMYRARLQPGPEPLLAKELGAPPAKIAGHGRANPVGIPYLYVASEPATAIAEVRPHTGETVWVLDFALPVDKLKIVDLRNPRGTISPFDYDTDELPKLHGDMPFLERWSQELTRPVVPGAAHLEYLPSQFLCEFVKWCAFDGVLYRSSVGSGVNLALFRPDRATAGADLKSFHIDHVRVDFSET